MLNQRTTFTIEECRPLIIELAVFLATLHKTKIVFRNLKPESIFISKDGHVRVHDFEFVQQFRNGRAFTLIGSIIDAIQV
jgi:serine/threonine protein kinase